MNRINAAVLLAGILGALGVAAGAWGAHALAGRLEPKALEWWKTGASYAQVHAVALLVVGTWGEGSPWARLGAVAFGVGVVLFAGTLFAMALGGPRWLGAITPLGGLGLLVGWASVAGAAFGRRG